MKQVSALTRYTQKFVGWVDRMRGPTKRKHIDLDAFDSGAPVFNEKTGKWDCCEEDDVAPPPPPMSAATKQKSAGSNMSERTGRFTPSLSRKGSCSVAAAPTKKAVQPRGASGPGPANGVDEPKMPLPSSGKEGSPALSDTDIGSLRREIVRLREENIALRSNMGMGDGPTTSIMMERRILDSLEQNRRGIIAGRLATERQFAKIESLRRENVAQDQKIGGTFSITISTRFMVVVLLLFALLNFIVSAGVVTVFEGNHPPSSSSIATMEARTLLLEMNRVVQENPMILWLQNKMSTFIGNSTSALTRNEL